MKINSVPGDIEVHEFDYKGINEVIYDENGVVIRSIPAIHAGDGPVSFILEWNGYKLVYAGDTAPNKWLMEAIGDSACVSDPRRSRNGVSTPSGIPPRRLPPLLDRNDPM